MKQPCPLKAIILEKLCGEKCGVKSEKDKKMTHNQLVIGWYGRLPSAISFPVFEAMPHFWVSALFPMILSMILLRCDAHGFFLLWLISQGCGGFTPRWPLSIVCRFKDGQSILACLWHNKRQFTSCDCEAVHSPRHSAEY